VKFWRRSTLLSCKGIGERRRAGELTDGKLLSLRLVETPVMTSLQLRKELLSLHAEKSDDGGLRLPRRTRRPIRQLIRPHLSRRSLNSAAGLTDGVVIPLAGVIYETVLLLTMLSSIA
jgi:hypothetical protein